MGLLKTALGYLAASYVKDVIVRPKQVAQLARSYCTRVGKPLLNVGAGTSRTSLRAAILGPTLWGDVNVDLAGRRDVRPGPRVVTFGDACNLREWPDRYFGAVIASHVLEHLDRPDIALAEWRRVADKVFVVVPPWWAPHTWLHPDHKWFIDASLKTAYPVWTDRQRVYLLQVSDKGYGPAPWSQQQSSQASQGRRQIQSLPRQQTSPSQSEPLSTRNFPAKSTGTQMTSRSPEQPKPLSGSTRTSKREPSPLPRGSLDIDSSRSISTLTVVSSGKSRTS